MGQATYGPERAARTLRCSLAKYNRYECQRQCQRKKSDAAPIAAVPGSNGAPPTPCSGNRSWEKGDDLVTPTHRFADPFDSRCANLRGLGNLLQLPGSDVVDIAVDRDALWDQRMLPNRAHIVDDRRTSVLEFEPIDLSSSR